jgi:hypothetical protein
VANAGLAHNVLSLNDLAPEILRIAGRMPAAVGQARELLKSVV